MPNLRLLAFSLAGFSMASGAAAESMADCRAIVADAERLACYDGLAGDRPARAVPKAIPPASASLAATAPPVGEGDGSPGKAPSLLGQAWELDPAERGHILRIRPYKPVYILPLFHASAPNRQPESPSPGHGSGEQTNLSVNEAKLQISLKSKVYEDVFGSNGDLWFGYTQSSRWQVYNGGISRPFRETNHEPELMLIWRTDYTLGGWHGRYAGLSLNHQSNGRSLPLSRSWNRIMLPVAFERDEWTLTLRPWWRIPESSGNDDNPDISSYLGRADLQLVRRWRDHQFAVMLRHSLQFGRDSHGAVQVDYAFPIAGEMRGHLQWFSGYGESLIDYNHRSNYYGVGVSLLEWY